ncbi:MAG: hypothetical protein IT355_04620 [Gemmatimonadaceae bacterium]|nr:hypothetical protein [Gemmatimonadaceae bacterium]
MTNRGVVAGGRELPRKTLHLTTMSVPVGLSLGVPQRTVALALLALFGVACGVEFARRRSRRFGAFFEGTFGSLLRPHERHRGITGATWLLAAFALTTLAAPPAAAIAATWAGAVGDGTAALAGRAWRQRHPGSGKTLAGSLACLVSTAAGAWWLAGFAAAAAAGLGAVAAGAERPGVAVDDNLRVTLAVALAAALFLASATPG